MYSLQAFVLCCLALGAISSELEDSENVIWADSDHANDTSIRKFSVKFEDDDIADLISRLYSYHKRSSLEHPPLEGAAFEYGFNTNVLQEWVDYWANDYDFKGRQEWLNTYPQFKTNIQGLDIHFIWVKPEVEAGCKVVPLLLLHGFPHTVIEFYQAIPKLTAGCVDGIALELVIPSLPGFAFSDSATKPGLGSIQIATVMANLMDRLGYEQFYVQSGDCFQIGSMLATKYPEKVLGFHTNNAVTYNQLAMGMWLAGSISPSLLVDPAYENRMYPVKDTIQKLMTKTGMIHMLATKPDTIGVAMTHCPVSLLVTLLEAASMETRNENVHQPDGGLGLFNRDDLLDTINYYWFPNSFTTAARIFANTFNEETYNNKLVSQRTSTPVWVVTAECEMIYQSPVQLRTKYEVMFTENHKSHGLFYAYEQPDLFTESVFAAISTFQKLHENK